ncbi:MAG: pantetheine-phosphate adenylyltransferase [Clostridia bacterium]|nr:pantetheine-phosphate adenylyltransferase [Clostridia bacterium]NCC75054.1 pantetheine-phosphate adenylyltransferase [Clostridia bacterium]
MTVFIYPGSFDPFTNGHYDIARRAAGLCDQLFVAVMVNSQKKYHFTAQERVEMASRVLKDIPNVSVESYNGLLVDFFAAKKARAVIRGLRSESDFRFEAELAAANKLLLPAYETCLMPCRIDLAFNSSSIVREVAAYGGDITHMVPPVLVPLIMERLRRTEPRDT